MNFGQTKRNRETIKTVSLEYALETSDWQENNILATFYVEYEF